MSRNTLRSPRRTTSVGLLLAAVLGCASAAVAGAEIIDINPSKDNTLYQYDPADGDRSNALGFHFFTGETAMGELRRGVVAFDIAGHIPCGSTITSVTLIMNMSRTPSDTARTVELHKLLADWGEGTSQASGEEGDGAPATPGDATWRHRFYDTVFWANQGGDFSPMVSASQSVGPIGQYNWSSPQMVADVQSWLDNPATNFGWLVLGDESNIATTKRFDTRESTSPPVLSVEFMPGPRCAPTPRPRPTPLPRPVAGAGPFSRPLRFPPVTTNANVSLGINGPVSRFWMDHAQHMWTFGVSYPGLTIRKPSGKSNHVSFTDNLDAAAGEFTTHNHGNHFTPENDRQPDDFLIAAGNSPIYTYDGMENGSHQRGKMPFYYDHRMDVTRNRTQLGNV